jgi:hypothetical protein
MTTAHDQDPPTEPAAAEPLRPATTGPDAGPARATASPTGGPEAAFSSRTAGPSRLRVGAVAGAAVALAVGAAATSLAATPPTQTPTMTSTVGTGSLAAPVAADLGLVGDGAHEHGRVGDRAGFRDITITSISGSNVTLSTEDGWTRTIAITDDVELTKGGRAIGVSDLVVGDQVRIGQTRADDGTYTVDAIAVVVPSVRGTVSDISATGFKVTNRDGSVWTITVNASTEYRYGTGEGSLSDVTNGSTVIVLGAAAGDNALTALTVRVAPDRAAGTVSSKTSDSIVITQRDGTSLTVHVDADTTYRVGGVDDADLGDVAVDMAIGVSGRERADGSIDADAVVAGEGRGFFRGDGFGRGGFRGGHGWDDDAVTRRASPSTSP